MAGEGEGPVEGQFQAPVYYGSGVQLSSNGSEVIFSFTAMIPSSAEVAQMRPVVSVSVPRGTASDLAVVLGGVLEALERDFGAINTPFQKERQAAK